MKFYADGLKYLDLNTFRIVFAILSSVRAITKSSLNFHNCKKNIDYHWMKRIALFLGFFSLCSSRLHSKDAELMQESFMRGLKMGGQYTQLSYTNTSYVAAGSSGVLTSQSQSTTLYGPQVGGTFYIVPTRFFHINLGLDLGLLLSNAAFYSSSMTTLFFSGFGQLGIRFGDFWPFAGFGYSSYSLNNSLVSARGGIEYRMDYWAFGAMYSQSISSSSPSGFSTYTNMTGWGLQLYATWLWGRWY